MPGFDNNVMYAGNVDFTGTSPVTGQVTTDGQLLIGATATPNIRVGTITSGDSSITVTPGAGTIALSVTGGGTVGKTITGDAGGALSPTAGNWNIVGTTAQGITSSGAGSTLTFTVADATETQKGVSELATDAEAIAGTDSVRTIVPTSLKAKLGAQTNHGFAFGTGTTTALAYSAEPSNGQLAIGSTGNQPTLATLTAGTGVSISNGAGSITINAVGGALTWSVVTVDASFTVNTGTIANKAGLLTMTLPASAAVGDIIEITGINTALGWKIAQNANQQIFFGASSTTVGAGGSIASTATRDSLKMVCVVAGASTVYNVLSSIGNLTVV